MNGSEVVTQRPVAVGKHELTDSEKMELTVLGSDPRCLTLFKLMEWEIEDAKDEAMEADPSKPAEQVALMTIAHAMNKFYKQVRSRMLVATHEHVADVKLKLAQKDLEDKSKIEAIILANQTSSS